MMRKITLLFLLALPLFSFSRIFEGKEAHERVPGSELVRFSERTGMINYIRYRAEITPVQLMSKRHAWMPEGIGIDDFRLIRTYQDELGFTHYRYQQTQHGIPVEGGILLVHEKDGLVKSMNADLFRVQQGPQAGLSESAALTKALNHVGANVYRWEQQGNAHYRPVGELMYAPVGGEFRQGNFRLVWKFDIYAVDPLSRADLYVDAHSGAVIFEANQLQHVDAVGSANTKYTGVQTITTDSMGPNSFRLRESGRGNGVQTLNMQTGTNYSNAVDFLDTDNYWNNINAAQDEAATDAHFGAEKTYDYYFLTHNWNSYDNQGTVMLSYIHYDQSFGNAFWDGTSMTYGDGGGPFTGPLTALDVVGHEFTHGVTQNSADLIYAGEPGGLNESFSDIFGVVIENYASGSYNWLIGEQVTNGTGIRNMANPNAFNDPDTYGGTFWPGGDPHIDSGVQNKWFEIITVGDTGVNDLNNAYSVTPIGITSAAAIAFRNLSVYLTMSSDYADARFFAIESAKDLFGACSNELIQVTNAWYAVGVGGQFSNVPAPAFSVFPTNYCTIPATVNFQNLSSPGTSYSWDFGDGSTSTMTNPSHTYNNWGTYTVKLVMTSCTNQMDSVVQLNYIVVDSNGICPIIMGSSGSQTFSSCSGLLLDPGGLGDYGNNVTSVTTISPVGAATVSLTFNSFDLEQGYDFLTIYDGPTATGVPIGTYSGTQLPNGGTVNSTGPSITLEFSSDFSVVAAGFDLNWQCVLATPPPVAGFTGVPQFTCDGQVQFTDQTLAGPTSWAWDFGDGNTSTQQNPTHTYTQSGAYDVRLIACNGAACDTLSYTQYIQVALNSSSCDTVPLPTTGLITETNCRGIATDDGGPGANYSDNVNSTIVIAPPGASGLELTFSSFDVESGVDFLTIYDGPTAMSPQIGAFTGNTLPQGGIITASGGALTLVFSSSVANNAPGFVATWVAFGANSGPQAAFTAPATTLVGINNNFMDQSSNAVSWNWDFGDGNSSTAQNPTHSYGSMGTYTVILEVMGAGGCTDTTQWVIDAGIIAVDEGLADQVQVWPNPATDQLRLRYEASGLSTGKIALLNTLGQTVFATETNCQGTCETGIPVGDLARGVYMVRLETDRGAIVKKVILK